MTAYTPNIAFERLQTSIAAAPAPDFTAKAGRNLLLHRKEPSEVVQRKSGCPAPAHVNSGRRGPDGLHPGSLSGETNLHLRHGEEGTSHLKGQEQT